MDHRSWWLGESCRTNIRMDFFLVGNRAPPILRHQTPGLESNMLRVGMVQMVFLHPGGGGPTEETWLGDTWLGVVVPGGNFHTGNPCCFTHGETNPWVFAVKYGEPCAKNRSPKDQLWLMNLATCPSFDIEIVTLEVCQCLLEVGMSECSISIAHFFYLLMMLMLVGVFSNHQLANEVWLGGYQPVVVCVWRSGSAFSRQDVGASTCHFPEDLGLFEKGTPHKKYAVRWRLKHGMLGYVGIYFFPYQPKLEN